jgi:pimeloyl-ACP methyl ester carboxylesterase
MTIIVRESKGACRLSLSLMLLLATVSTASAGSLGGPLELQDFGSFFVGGRAHEATHPGPFGTGQVPAGQIRTGQMYVQYLIPKTVSRPAIVLVPGAVHTGAAYETTPDGREGWATYFARKGFPVYVVDHAGRARSGFDPTPVNRAKVEGNTTALPQFLIATRELAWEFFRIGPSHPTPHPGTQFPVDALDQYVSQLVPNTESTLPGAGANTVAALAALLDKIGPAVVLVHSQSGAYGMDLVRNHAAKVRAFVNVEGNCVPATPDEIANTFKKVPMLAVWGDFSEGAPGPNGDTRRNGCVGTIKALQAAGGPAQYLLLPEVGQKGNSHMLMLDKNNLAIADLIIGWIGENVRGM